MSRLNCNGSATALVKAHSDRWTAMTFEFMIGIEAEELRRRYTEILRWYRICRRKLPDDMKSITHKAFTTRSLESMIRPILAWLILGGAVSAKAEFQAGVAAVDITPPKFPVRVNGMFTERSADRAIDTRSSTSSWW